MGLPPLDTRSRAAGGILVLQHRYSNFPSPKVHCLPVILHLCRQRRPGNQSPPRERLVLRNPALYPLCPGLPCLLQVFCLALGLLSVGYPQLLLEHSCCHPLWVGGFVRLLRQPMRQLHDIWVMLIPGVHLPSVSHGPYRNLAVQHRGMAEERADLESLAWLECAACLQKGLPSHYLLLRCQCDLLAQTDVWLAH